MTEEIKDDVIGDLYEEESVEEAKGHDPKNAEANAVAATDKAADATKPAPKRKGDKDKKDQMMAAPGKAKDAGAQPTEAYKMPKTKSAMMNGMYQKMSKMKKEELADTYAKLMAEDTEEVDTVIDAKSDVNVELRSNFIRRI